MPADRTSDTANALALAKKIVARDSNSLSALGAALQGLTSVTCLEPTSQQLAKLLMKYVGRDDVDMDAMCRLGSGLELVAAFHRLSRLNVQTFVHANGHLNPVAALTKAVAVPRSPAPSMKTPWKHMKPKHSGARGEVTWADEIKEHRNLPPVVAPTSTLRSMYAAHSGSQSALGKDRAQFVVTFWILCLLALVVYVSLRIWDIVEMHFTNGGPWKSVYRTAVLLVEATYAVAALAYLRLAWTVPKHVTRRRDFKPEALVTVLMATDENADTIVTSVMAHTNAVRPPRIPIKIIVVVQTYSDAVKEARDRIAQLVSNVTFLDYQQLADHEPGTTLLGEDAPIVETIAVPRRMTMSQALYLCLSGINRKYPLDRAVVCVAEASVMINTLEHYKFAISKLRQKGTAVVSFPCVAQNESAVADLMDLSAQRLQQVVLPAIQVSGQCVVSHMCFAGRGTDMLNVLRAMELDSAGSRTLAWLPFYIHKTVGFSKRATPVLDGPPASTLNPRNGPARLAAAVYPIMEQWDIGSFLSRQFGARWTWASGLTVPHIMYCCTILLEATVIVVTAVAAWAHVAPASAGRVLMASVFTLHYGLLILSGLLTTAGFQFSMLSTMLAARILVPFLVTVYGFGQSRFGAAPGKAGIHVMGPSSICNANDVQCKWCSTYAQP